MYIREILIMLQGVDIIYGKMYVDINMETQNGNILARCLNNRIVHKLKVLIEGYIWGKIQKQKQK